MSYNAIVTRIHTKPLPGADRIQLGSCQGYQVIVNKDVQDGQLGVFFDAGGQLSLEFALKNDLLRKLPDGTPGKGYFEENRRIRSIRLLEQVSNGFWCPLDHLAYTGVNLDSLVEGTKFDELNGHAICNKYFTPETLRTQQANQKKVRKSNIMFAKHIDTAPFKSEIGSIPEGAIIYITEKLHGTSFRYGHVREEKPIVYTGIKKWLSKWLNLPVFSSEWIYLNGSRNVVLETRAEGAEGYYGKEEFRFAATRNIALRKGEVIYGELVGYTETGATIMSVHNTAVLKDPKVTKQFGDEITYRYGAADGAFKTFIYRITQVNDDGHVVELSWPQVVARCFELGLTPVPLIERFIYDGDQKALLRKVGLLTDGASGSEAIPSRLDPTHIQEGVVLRFESEYGTDWLKSKSWVFYTLEGFEREKDTYVDTEEVS
jgi:hypothetical protein